MKFCKKCATEKPLFDFQKNKANQDGYQRYCKQCIKHLNADWYAKNKEKKLAQAKDWYYKNADRKTITQKAWLEKNYLKDQKDRQVRRQTRRAREANAEGKFSIQDIKKIRILQQDRCAACEKKLTKYHIDHIMPLKLNGSNWPSNLQLLCPSCNLRKNAKHPLEWAKANGKLL
jgi:5-methylcytosine-specific restriction endonuclease McrA